MNQISGHPLYKVHTIDSAISSLWDFYSGRFISLFLISFSMGLILQYISSLITIDLGDYKTLNVDEMMLKLREYLGPMILVSLVGLLFTTILQYYVIYSPIDPEKNILNCLISSLKFYIPYLIIMVFLGIAASFALFIGLLMIIVGVLFAAIYIMTVYLFILPVMMVEGPHIGNTISRTIVLSHKNFWSNIGWTAVFLIIILVITTIFSGLILLPFAGSFMNVIKNPDNAGEIMEITSKPLYIILSSVLNGITLPLLPIFSAILYFNGIAREQPHVNFEPNNDYDTGRPRIEDLYSKPREEDDEV